MGGRGGRRAWGVRACMRLPRPRPRMAMRCHPMRGMQRAGGPQPRTVGVEHGALELHHGRLVGVLLRELQRELEGACVACHAWSSRQEAGVLRGCWAGPRSPTSVPRRVLWPEYHRVPQHDVVGRGRAVNALGRVLLQALEIPHQALRGSSARGKGGVVCWGQQRGMRGNGGPCARAGRHGGGRGTGRAAAARVCAAAAGTHTPCARAWTWWQRARARAPSIRSAHSSGRSTRGGRSGGGCVCAKAFLQAKGAFSTHQPGPARLLGGLGLRARAVLPATTHHPQPHTPRGHKLRGGS